MSLLNRFYYKPPSPEQSLRRVALRYGSMAGQKEELAEADGLHHLTGLLAGYGVHKEVLDEHSR